MQSVRAKFTLIHREENPDGFNLSFQPVIGGSPENEEFFKYTPGGELRMGTINPDAAKFFEIGQDYYLDLTPAT